MSKKMALPDSMLDAVSGGTAYLNGDIVTGIDMNGDGMQVTTAKGTFQMDWSAAEKKEFATNPKELMEDLATARGMMNDSTVELEFNASQFRKL